MLPASLFGATGALAGAVVVEAVAALPAITVAFPFGIGMQGCSGATCPGSTAGAGFRISPAGQGCISSTGRRFAGGGGGSTAPARTTVGFAPGHT